MMMTSPVIEYTSESIELALRDGYPNGLFDKLNPPSLSMDLQYVHASLPPYSMIHTVGYRGGRNIMESCTLNTRTGQNIANLYALSPTVMK